LTEHAGISVSTQSRRCERSRVQVLEARVAIPIREDLVRFFEGKGGLSVQFVVNAGVQIQGLTRSILLNDR
jgi:hypothetical protein